MARFNTMAEPSAFRKLAASMWRAPNNPTIFAEIALDFTNAREFLSLYNKRNSCRVTPTHLVGRAVGLAFQRYPEANARVGVSNIVLRDSADVSFLIATEDGRDMWSHKLTEIDRDALVHIERKLREAARVVREHRDPAIERGRWLLRALPLWLLRPFIALAGTITNRLNRSLTFLGFPADPFGTATITNVGMYGFQRGMAALTPPSPSSIVVGVMTVRDEPWVVDGHVTARPILRLCCTFDHRTMDGALIAAFLNHVEHCLLAPQTLLTEAESRVSRPD